jgi:NADPH-dependent 2,4-dienoyl-CoA reductase/sulfur reductase-like enzyme
MAGDAAVQGIRDLDPQGSIGMIGEEKDPPYNRAPLSKGLWTGRESLEAVWRRTQERNVNLHLGRRAQKLDAQGRVVVDDHGEMYTFDKLLLATGGRPRRLPFGQDSIVYFRTLEDYRQLRAAAEQRRRFAVIGGGFIGSEIAAALATIGKEVTMIFPEIGIGGHMFPPELYRFLNNYYRQKGVQVLSGEFVSGAPQIVAGEFVSGLDRSGDEYVLHTSGGRQVVVDGIVAGIGIEPNTDLAQQANLTVEDGICVDECLRTSHPDIYAAGDVARFYSPALGRSLRVEHEDNANAMGRMAGRNMAGASEPYHCLPCFHSKLFDLGYEPSASWTPACRPHPTGKIPSTKASSTISSSTGFAACCSGTSGSGPMPPATWSQRCSSCTRRASRAAWSLRRRACDGAPLPGFAPRDPRRPGRGRTASDVRPRHHRLPGLASIACWGVSANLRFSLIRRPSSTLASIHFMYSGYASR